MAQGSAPAADPRIAELWNSGKAPNEIDHALRLPSGTARSVLKRLEGLERPATVAAYADRPPKAQTKAVRLGAYLRDLDAAPADGGDPGDVSP